MTIISINKNSIEVSGHTCYEDFGKDIVCASISSIVTTSVNAIIRIDDDSIKYVVKDGYIKIDILKHTEVIDILITNMIEELKSLEKKYQKNIKINV